MDWRNNQWVGIGAAVLLVVAIVGIFLWSTGDSASRAASRMQTYQCKSTGETFQVSEKEMEDMDTYVKYTPEMTGDPVECKICGEKDAYMVYFCPDPECNKYYPYEVRHGMADFIRCPEGHTVPEEYH